MSTQMRFSSLFLIGLVPLLSTGCIVVGVGGWGWSCCGTTVWTEPVTEQLAIDTVDLKALEVRTHNGSIAFAGQGAQAGEAYVIVTKKAGGRTMADAEAAFEALDVYVEPTSGSTQRIGWRWKGIKHSNWGASVAFDIKAPGDIRFDGKTHNGRVEIDGLAGDVRVVTHNGPMNVTSAEGKLYGKTHNGKIVATYDGDDVKLITHNGRITADLSRCAVLGGTITTHNGSVEVVVGEDSSTSLTARTHNGSIECDVPLSSGRYSKCKLTGTIGTGQGTLDVITHNGSVRIRKSAG